MCRMWSAPNVPPDMGLNIFLASFTQVLGRLFYVEYWTQHMHCRRLVIRTHEDTRHVGSVRRHDNQSPERPAERKKPCGVCFAEQQHQSVNLLGKHRTPPNIISRTCSSNEYIHTVDLYAKLQMKGSDDWYRRLFLVFRP